MSSVIEVQCRVGLVVSVPTMTVLRLLCRLWYVCWAAAVLLKRLSVIVCEGWARSLLSVVCVCGGRLASSRQVRVFKF